MTMYEGWRVSRWLTPVVDVNRLLMVSLSDADRELTIVLEAFRAPGRPRWRVRFRDYVAYRNIDEAYRLGLWRWLDHSAQRCGFTFTVVESPQFASWAAGYLHEVRPTTQHYTIATEDDVIEVLAAAEPVWDAVEPAQLGSPLPGKGEHLYVGEDDEAIDRLAADLQAKSNRK